MKPSTFTARRLRAVVKAVKKNPKTYNQSRWCGTSCCVAGHAVLKFGNAQQRADVSKNGADANFMCGAYARKLLQLPIEANKLFESPELWPYRFTTRAGKVTPHLLGKRVEHYITTGSTA